MNVFPTYDQYTDCFVQFILSLEPGAVLIYNREDPEVVRVVEQTLARHPELQGAADPLCHPSLRDPPGKVWLVDGSQRATR